MKRLALGLGLALGIALGLWLWQRHKAPPRSEPLRIVHLRGASETAVLQHLWPKEAIVLHRQPGEPLPDFDAIIGTPADLEALQKSALVSEGQALYEEGYQVLYVNKKKGLAAPKTWDELVGLTVKDASQAFGRFGLAMSSEAFSAMPFVSRAWIDDQGAVRPTLHNAYLQEGMDTLKMLRSTFSLTPRDCSAACAAQLFVEGKAPFLLAGEWRWLELRQKLGQDLAIAPLPAFASGASFTPRTTVMLAWSRRMNASQQASAQQFRAQLQSAEGRARIFSALHKVPSAYLEDMKSPIDVTATDLIGVIKNSTRPMQEARYQHLLQEIRSPIQDYYQGHLASTEALDLLAKVAL